MSAYMIVHSTVLDGGWLEDYVRHVPDMIRSHGGDYVALSGPVEKLEGSLPIPDRIVVFSFPSMAAVKAFMDDPGYKPFKDARQKGAETCVFAFEPAAL